LAGNSIAFLSGYTLESRHRLFTIIVKIEGDGVYAHTSPPQTVRLFIYYYANWQHYTMTERYFDSRIISTNWTW